jgi:hypothetical protein
VIFDNFHFIFVQVSILVVIQIAGVYSEALMKQILVHHGSKGGNRFLTLLRHAQ